MLHRFIITVICSGLTLIAIGQQGGALFGQEAPAICKILADETFVTIDKPSDVTTMNGDDGSYINNPIQLPFTFSFFGQQYNQIYLNINGNITFDGNYATYNTTSFTTFDKKMIAPFWADIDLVFSHESTLGQQGKILFKVNPTNIIIVWEEVGYYGNRIDKLNTFQLVMTNGSDPLLPSGSNVGFYYESMNWTSGYASQTDNGFCGYPATVGITYGDQRNYFQIGRFDHLGNRDDYHGDYPNNISITPPGCNSPNGIKYFDGVKWLEKRCNLTYDISEKVILQNTACKPLSNSYDLKINYFVVDFPQSGELVFKIDGNEKRRIQIPTEIPVSGPLFYQITDLIADGQSHLFEAEFTNAPSQNVTKTFLAPIACRETSCSECVTSFSPLSGEEYQLSAWIREDYRDMVPATYRHSGVRIIFDDDPGTAVIYRPSGPIIEGWQRVDASFTIPPGAGNISIGLVNEKTEDDVYFDDIRIHPFRSNMKSFVYDPSTQRLVAELDENNYATRYEYDDEGILIRVKKETERGVMTIKETRTNQSKIHTD